jgi:hypothetical protein
VFAGIILFHMAKVFLPLIPASNVQDQATWITTWTPDPSL